MWSTTKLIMVSQTLSSTAALLFTFNIMLLLVFFVSYLPGINSAWYNSLKMPNFDPWIARGLWLVAAFLSYVGLYLILLRVPTNKGLLINDFYLIGGFLTIIWSVAFLQLQDLRLAVWLSLLLFLYQLWLLTYIFWLSPFLSLFLVPLVIMYFYLVYSMIDLALLNQVPL